MAKKLQWSGGYHASSFSCSVLALKVGAGAEM